MMTDLSASLDDYLKLRRALGYKLSDAERHLRKFIAFLEVMGEKRITTCGCQAAINHESPDGGKVGSGRAGGWMVLWAGV